MIHLFHRPTPRIDTIESLRAHLQIAIELEHATIGLFVRAVHDRDGANAEAARVIRSVVMEEMLHMALAANVLNAIGGAPSLNHSKFVLNTRPPCRTAITSSSSTGQVLAAVRDDLKAIERPAKAGARASRPVSHDRPVLQAIIDGLKSVCLEDRISPATRLDRWGRTPTTAGVGRRPGSGLDSAVDALRVIVERERDCHTRSGTRTGSCSGSPASWPTFPLHGAAGRATTGRRTRRPPGRLGPIAGGLGRGL